jgi:hypothetical protein
VEKIGPKFPLICIGNSLCGVPVSGCRIPA